LSYYTRVYDKERREFVIKKPSKFVLLNSDLSQAPAMQINERLRLKSKQETLRHKQSSNVIKSLKKNTKALTQLIDLSHKKEITDYVAPKTNGPKFLHKRRNTVTEI